MRLDAEGGVMVEGIRVMIHQAVRPARLALRRLAWYIRTYPDRGTPPPYEGPKFRAWKKGVEVTDDIS